SLTKYFDHIIICGEDIKEKKPNEKPYKIILKKLKIQPDEVLVIGDKPLVDLAPAQKLGINTVCLSRKTQIKWSTKIRSLNEIFSILQPK
ncbi:MAG: HAD family hydrolase, partial [candidate division WOR-3 bacterium]